MPYFAKHVIKITLRLAPVIYRLKQAMIALDRDGDGRATIITLEPGVFVQTSQPPPELPEIGLIDVMVDGATFAVFRQDLEERGECIDCAESL